MMDAAEAEQPSRRDGDWWPSLRRVLVTVGGLSLLLIAISVIGLQLLNTRPGQAWLARQLGNIAPESGLTIAVGRIDGSLFSNLTIYDLRLGDPKGVFLASPAVVLNWDPTAILSNRLHITRLSADEVRLLRRPALRESAEPQPLLPKFDMHVGRLAIDRLLFEPPVVGRRHVARVSGRATIRAGRALVQLDATAPTGGDRIALHLDSEPDRDRFDLEAGVRAPMNGVLTSLLRLNAPLDVRIAGDGRWSAWRGEARATLGSRSLADIRINVLDGQFSLSGTAAPGLVTTGVVQRLTGPQVTLSATALFANRRLDGTLRAASAALRLDAQGAIDLDDDRFEGVAINARLLQPSALLRRLSGRDIRLAVTVEGARATPTIDYVLTSPQFALGRTGFERFRAAGTIQVDEEPLVIPLAATAARVTGVGTAAGGLLTNVRVEGPLRVRSPGPTLYSNELRLRSDRLIGRAVASLSLRTGVYDVKLLTELARYLIPGLGLVNVEADLHAVPDPVGGTRVRGKATAKVVRLDNAFFRSLLGGLPTLTADLDWAPTGVIGFSNARLTSPLLRLTGSGVRQIGGIYEISAAGQSVRYGPVGVTLKGQLSRPDLGLRFVRLGYGIGLRDVTAQLAASPTGWSVEARGVSNYGPVTARGQLVLRPNQPLLVDIAQLNAIGLVASGPLVQSNGLFAGTLAVNGPGLSGTVKLSPSGAVQRADVALSANQARLSLDSPVAIGSGTLSATVLLQPDAPSVTGRVTVAQLRRGNLIVEAGTANIDYRDGRGRATGYVRGEQGVPFALNLDVTATPERLTVGTVGTVDTHPVRLAAPAELTRLADGWQLAPVIVRLPDGQAQLSGQFTESTALHTRLDAVGLRVLNLFLPELDLTGRASGSVELLFPGGNALPRGTANLRISGLSRAGLSASSLPVDLAINARIDADSAAARAVLQRRGRVVGRMQGVLRPIPGGAGDSITERLLSAPLSAQLRWNGPTGALWPLIGVEAFEVRGPVAIAADLGGHLGEPTVSGTIRANGARLESTILGTVIENIVLDSSFDGSRLVLKSVSGTSGRDGRVTGSGSIDLSALRGFPIDLQLQLARAQILRRDDLRATATGPLRITSGPQGGLIRGNLSIDSARFRIGRPAIEQVPELDVEERNADLVRRSAPPRRPTVWKLDVQAAANNDVEVDGLGLESEWRTDLHLTGPVDQPSISGNAELLRGSYEFAGRRFELTRGLLRFTGGYPPDPIVDLVAEARVEGLTATLRIGGTARQPEISFGSVPALPEDEVLSRVLFGSSITELSAPEALQLAGAITALRRDGGANLDVFNTLRRATGIDRLRILPGDTTKGRGAAVAAGEYLGNRVYVEVATDARGYTATQLELELTRSLSILAQIQTFGGNGVNLRWSKDY